MAHQARITKNADGDFYALIVRIDRDGQESVIHGYKGAHQLARLTNQLVVVEDAN